MELLTIVVIIFSLILIYFLGSTLVSLILELWNFLRKNREKFLEQQLSDRLGKETAKGILEHEMVSGNSKSSVSKINEKVFGYVASQHLTKDSPNVLNSAVEAYGSPTKSQTTTEPNKDSAKVSSTDDSSTTSSETSSEDTTTDGNNSGQSEPAERSTASTQEALSSWYRDFSEEMSSGFKSSLRLPALMVAAIVVVLLNLDTLRIISTIWDNPEDTSELVATLKTVDWKSLSQEPDLADTAALSNQIEGLMTILSKFDTLEDAGLPIGWHSAEELGLGIPASDTATTLNFQRVIQVDTSSGRPDTTYSFSYLPPTGAAVFQPQAKVIDTIGTQLAVFGTAIPDPNPVLKEVGGALNLDFSKVFGRRDLDQLTASFKGISGSTYSFAITAHLEEERATALQIIAANLRTVNGTTLIGWLISILAIGMGAPFWYDVLKWLANLLAKKAT